MGPRAKIYQTFLPFSDVSKVIGGIIARKEENPGYEAKSATYFSLSATKVHSRSVDPQKNRRNYLITRSILIFQTPRGSSLQRRSFDIR